MQLGIIADPVGCGVSPDGGVDGPIDAAVPPPDASVVYPSCCAVAGSVLRGPDRLRSSGWGA